MSELVPNNHGILKSLKKLSQKNFSPNSNPKKLPRENKTGVEPAQLAVDVHEDTQNFFITAPLAGVDIAEVRVQIKEDVVVIEGERVHPLAHLANAEKLANECFFGPFLRSIVLPESINSKQATAEFKKNVLVITLPKLDAVRTRIIKIQKTE